MRPHCPCCSATYPFFFTNAASLTCLNRDHPQVFCCPLGYATAPNTPRGSFAHFPYCQTWVDSSFPLFHAILHVPKLCSAPPALRRRHHTASLPSDMEKLSPGKPSSNSECKSRTVRPGTPHLGSLRTGRGASEYSPHLLQAGRRRGRKAGPRAAALPSRVLVRLCNWTANAAFMVGRTQIKRGNYSPDAQFA